MPDAKNYTDHAAIREYSSDEFDAFINVGADFMKAATLTRLPQVKSVLKQAYDQVYDAIDNPEGYVTCWDFSDPDKIIVDGMYEFLDDVEFDLMLMARMYHKMTGTDKISVMLSKRLDLPLHRDDHDVLNATWGGGATVVPTNDGDFQPDEGDFLWMKAGTAHKSAKDLASDAKKLSVIAYPMGDDDFEAFHQEASLH